MKGKIRRTVDPENDLDPDVARRSQSDYPSATCMEMGTFGCPSPDDWKLKNYLPYLLRLREQRLAVLTESVAKLNKPFASVEEEL